MIEKEREKERKRETEREESPTLRKCHRGNCVAQCQTVCRGRQGETRGNREAEGVTKGKGERGEEGRDKGECRETQR